MIRAPRPRGRPSIQTDLFNSAFSVLAAIAVFWVLATAVLAFVGLREELINANSVRIAGLADSLARPLSVADRFQTERILHAWVAANGAGSAIVLDAAGDVAAVSGTADSQYRLADAAVGSTTGLSEVRISSAVNDDDVRIGLVVATFTLDAVYHQIVLAAASLLLLAMLTLWLGRYVLKRLAIRVLRPLAELAAVADAVALSPDNGQRAIEGGPREVADLAKAFNTMLDVLQNKSEALDQKMRQSALTEAELGRLTLTDPMTHLGNRAGFLQELARVAERSLQEGSNIAVVHLDLDDFKVINDSLGHEVGDRLLQAVAERLSARRRDGDSICRVGGDEFALILASITSLRTAVDVVVTMLSALTETYEIDGRNLHIRASAGIALYPAQTEDLANLVRFADLAMHQAKSAGKNDYCVYTSELLSRTNDRLSMESELRRGLDNDEFELHYQPQVDIQSGRVVGLEALLRWRHPSGELIQPGYFIPVAEQSDLIVILGRKIITMACRQWQEWREEGIEPRRLAINISGRQLADDDFASELLATMTQSGYPLPRLELEITESLLLSGMKIAKGTFRRLVAAGLEWSLDDFGTGYSSLTYLTKYPIHNLKIDRSFVTRLPGDESSEAIVKAILAMAKGLGMQVVVEGVETKDQIDYLKSIGAVVVQGYYYYRPLAADAISDLLRQQATVGVSG
jgi:diguanylate cyclase (GGDEF)-like protein